MKIAIGSDHAGFYLKKDIIKYLEEKNIEVLVLVLLIFILFFLFSIVLLIRNISCLRKALYS